MKENINIKYWSLCVLFELVCVCVCVCVCVGVGSEISHPYNVHIRWTDMVPLYSEASYVQGRFITILGEGFSILSKEEMAPRKQIENEGAGWLPPTPYPKGP